MGEQLFAIVGGPRRTFVRPVYCSDTRSNTRSRALTAGTDSRGLNQANQDCNGNRNKFTKKKISWPLQRNNSRFLTQSCF